MSERLLPLAIGLMCGVTCALFISEGNAGWAALEAFFAGANLAVATESAS